MRVVITCEPPLLTEVVSLALSRINGIEITRPDASGMDVLVASSSTDWQARRSPKTILLDEASTLPALVDTLTAWVSHEEGEDYSLSVSGCSTDNPHAPMSRSVRNAKHRSVQTPEFILIPVIEGTSDTRGTDVGRVGE